MTISMLLEAPLQEREDLRAKKIELASLEAELIECECYLASLRLDLYAFERQFLARVGHIYLKIDEWASRTTELIAQVSGTEDARRVASKARDTAEATRAAVEREAHERPRVTATAELKALYRRATKLAHPDLAVSESERQRRTCFMSDINVAFQRGDTQAIQALLERFGGGAVQHEPNTTQDEVDRINASIARLFERLRTTKQEIHTLETSDLCKLMRSAKELAISTADLLERLAASATDDLIRVQEQYEQVKHQVRDATI